MEENKDLIKRIEEVESYGNKNSMKKKDYIVVAILSAVCLSLIIAGGFIK